MVFNRAQRTRWRRWIAAEGPRFVLRVHAVSEDGDAPVRIGTSVEQTPSNAPDLEAVEATLEDDAENRIRLAPGARLRARDFEGAGRSVVEAVTSAGGMRQRFSFHVPPTLDFWILDAPGIHRGPDVLPSRPEGWEITTRRQPIPRDVDVRAPILRWPLAALALGVVAATALARGWVGPWAITAGGALVGIAAVRIAALGLAVLRVPVSPGAARPDGDDDRLSVTIAQFDSPLFTYRLGDAETWLCPAKRTEGPRVLLLDVSDPHSTPHDDPRDALVTSVASVLGEAVWLETDLAAVVGVPVVVGRVRVQQTGAAKSYEELASFVSKFEGRNLVVWGEAKSDPAREGYVLRLRATEAPGTEEETIEGPLPEIGTKLVDWMVRRGWCRRETAPPAFAAPAGEVLDGYQRVLSNLVLSSMIHPQNRALPNPTPDFPSSVADLAASVAAAAPGSARAKLAWWVAVIYAHEIGGLSTEARGRAIDSARETKEGDALYAITPMVLWRLQAFEEARRRRDALLASAAAPYRDGGGALRDWLGTMEDG